MEYVVAILLGAVGSVVAAELLAGTHAIACWIIERAVARLHERDRDFWREVWQADINEWNSGFSRVRRSIGFYRSARVLADELNVTVSARLALPGNAPKKEELVVRRKVILRMRAIAAQRPDSERFFRRALCLYVGLRIDFSKEDLDKLDEAILNALSSSEQVQAILDTLEETEVGADKVVMGVDFKNLDKLK